jgi:5'-phosphate synthase pdxT subunit
MTEKIKIGVLALQGSFAEHLAALRQLKNVEPLAVKTRSTLDQVAGLILPGGESTTQAKLLKEFDLFEPLQQKINSGLPVWGTCAGLILLAKEIINESADLQVMDITVRRNAYGRQMSSFMTKTLIPEISDQPLPLTFIRAPWIEKVASNVKVLCQVNSRIVAVRQANLLATAFHPELTSDLSFHRYFVEQLVLKQNSAIIK